MPEFTVSTPNPNSRLPHPERPDGEPRDTRSAEFRGDPFRELAESVEDIFCVADAKQRKIIYVNPAYEKISGRTREKLFENYKDWMEAVHPDDRQRVAENFHWNTMQGRFDEEFRIVRADGTTAWIRGRCYPVLGACHEVERIIAVAQDITDRKLAQEIAQRHSRAMEEQAQLLELASDAIIARDSASRVLFWNKGAEALYGWTAAEALGRNLHELLGTPAESVNDFRAVLQECGEWLGELRHETRSRRQLIVQSRQVLQRDANGNVERILEINRDISERKRAEAALMETQQHLEQLVAQRTSALQELSGRLLRMQDEERRRIARELHDSMGQELSVMKMLLESAIQRGIADPENQRGVYESLRMTENVLKQVRSLSYLLHPPLLDEMGLVPALRWYVDGLAQRSGLQISLLIEPPEFGRLAPELETALFRIVQESLTNVYKHSESPTAVVRLEKTGSEVRLQVEDGGKGIPSDKLDKLPSTIGVGIGGMRERVRQFGGDVRISSNQGTGTTIEVVFPLHRTADIETSSRLRDTA